MVGVDSEPMCCLGHMKLRHGFRVRLTRGRCLNVRRLSNRVGDGVPRRGSFRETVNRRNDLGCYVSRVGSTLMCPKNLPVLLGNRPKDKGACLVELVRRCYIGGELLDSSEGDQEVGLGRVDSKRRCRGLRRLLSRLRSNVLCLRSVSTYGTEIRRHLTRCVTGKTGGGKQDMGGRGIHLIVDTSRGVFSRVSEGLLIGMPIVYRVPS